MNTVIPFDQSRALRIKTEEDLPPHITFEQFKKVHDALLGLDQLFWGLSWETGGRVSAVLSIRWRDIDETRNELKLLVQKKKVFTTVKIPLSAPMMNDLRNYRMNIKPEPADFIFKTGGYHNKRSKSGMITRQTAWRKVKKWGKEYLGLDEIHPHMLRHGLAIYLVLVQGVPIEIVSSWLGHANPFITAKSYLVITPALRRQMTAHVPMR